MKEFFSNLFFYLFLILIAIVVILCACFNLVSFCEPIVLTLGGGSILRGILLLPFAIFGMIQIIRGSIKVFDSDANNMESILTKYEWVAPLYFLLSIFSYFVLFQFIQDMPVL
jgi:hypothetical protein